MNWKNKCADCDYWAFGICKMPEIVYIMDEQLFCVNSWRFSIGSYQEIHSKSKNLAETIK